MALNLTPGPNSGPAPLSNPTSAPSSPPPAANAPIGQPPAQLSFGPAAAQVGKKQGLVKKSLKAFGGALKYGFGSTLILPVAAGGATAFVLYKTNVIPRDPAAVMYSGLAAAFVVGGGVVSWGQKIWAHAHGKPKNHVFDKIARDGIMAGLVIAGTVWGITKGYDYGYIPETPLTGSIIQWGYDAVTPKVIPVTLPADTLGAVKVVGVQIERTDWALTQSRKVKGIDQITNPGDIYCVTDLKKVSVWGSDVTVAKLVSGKDTFYGFMDGGYFQSAPESDACPAQRPTSTPNAQVQATPK